MNDRQDARSKYNTTNEELTDLVREITQSDMLSDVAEFVCERYEEAAIHRMTIGVDDRILSATYAVKSELSRQQRARLQDGDPDIPLGVSATKVTAAISWVNDIVSRAKDKPWTITPTPKPSISPAAAEAVMRKLEEEFPTELDMGAEDSATHAVMMDRANLLKSNVAKYEMDVAMKAAVRMETLIADQLSEGGWRETYAMLIADTMTYPVAITKGPVYSTKKKLKWENEVLTPVEESVISIRRVDPIDFYPSPQSHNMQDGQYVIEVAAMTAEQLLGLDSFPGYVAQSADYVVQMHREGHGLSRCVKKSVDNERGVKPDASLFAANANSLNTYDVIIYHGRVEAEMLRSYGVDVPEKRFVDAEIWVCDKTVLLARLNPHLLGRRPYQHTSFRKLPGSFWGQGIPDVLTHVDRVCNAAVLNMTKNMAYSAGPMGEVDSERLVDPTSADSIAPYTLIPVTADSAYSSAKTPAIKFYSIPNTTRALMEIYDRFAKLADDISGIPAYTMGNPSVAGAGRTLGGLSLLMGNAAKGIKDVIGNMDIDVIQPIVADIYMINMMDASVDMACKAEATVVANGSSGILQRELNQSRIAELLQVVTPYTQIPVTGPQNIIDSKAIIYLLREQVKAMGFDPDKIAPDPELTKHLQNPTDGDTTGLTGAPPPSTELGTPLPSLDGRSATPPDPATNVALPSV